MQAGKPAGDHRRGRRGRGPRHARRQQDPRHVQVGRRQGPRLRRAPQGDAAGHGHPHRRPGHLRGGRPQAREHHARPARHGPQGRRHQGRDHHRRGRRRRGRHQGPHQPDQGRDREHRLRLRPREAPGAPRQAVRRRRRPQGRRGHRGGAQGEEAPHRGRGVRPPRPPSRRASSPGGGVALLRAQAAVLEVADDARGRRGHRRPPRRQGARGAAQADRRATPASRAASSSSRCETSSGADGLNAATGEYEDLVKAGVIDAAKVTRSALQNAASIAALFLTTEAVIADKPEKDAGGGMPGGGMEDF